MVEKKKVVGDETEFLKTKAQQGQVLIGLDRVLKSIKGNKVNKDFLASNCPPKMKEDVTYYATLAQVPVLEAKLNNEELGLVCKKNFLVSVVGIISE